MDTGTVNNVVTSALGTIIGAAISWWFAERYYRKQTADTEQQISAVTATARHMTENFARFLEKRSARRSSQGIRWGLPVMIGATTASMS